MVTAFLLEIQEISLKTFFSERQHSHNVIKTETTLHIFCWDFRTNNLYNCKHQSYSDIVSANKGCFVLWQIKVSSLVSFLHKLQVHNDIQPSLYPLNERKQNS